MTYPCEESIQINEEVSERVRDRGEWYRDRGREVKGLGERGTGIGGSGTGRGGKMYWDKGRVVQG